MSRGKHLSFEEPRRDSKLARFAKEHPAEGDADLSGERTGTFREHWAQSSVLQ